MTPQQQISQGKHILKMIEAVDKDDVDTLDEIDARFWCLVNGYEFSKCVEGIIYKYVYEIEPDDFDFSETEYTRSRDALKGARLDGWYYDTNTDKDGTICYGDKGEWGTLEIRSPDLSTEELAEFWAITQSRIYELEMEGEV